MAEWKSTIRIKHLLTSDTEWEKVQVILSNILTELKKSPEMSDFVLNYEKDFNISYALKKYSAEDYANNLLGFLYNYCDENRIWIA